MARNERGLMFRAPLFLLRLVIGPPLLVLILLMIPFAVLAFIVDAFTGREQTWWNEGVCWRHRRG